MFIKVLFTNSLSLSIKFTVNVKFCKCDITLNSYNIFISQIKGIHQYSYIASTTLDPSQVFDLVIAATWLYIKPKPCSCGI